MDDSSLCCTSGNPETICHSSASSGDHDRVDVLSTNLSGQLQINDGIRADTPTDLRKVPIERDCIEEDEDEDDDYFSEKALLAQMGYAESGPRIDYEEEEEEDLSDDSILAQMGYLKNEPPKHEPINPPIAELNLVSALKGSREKEGRPGEECRVSWASDVYDPPCTSDDHFTQSSTERHRSELKAKGVSGKNRQKTGGKGSGVMEGRVGGGKGSRGGGSKGSEGGTKAAGGSKDKKKAEKKHKKHGGSTGSKYSNPCDF